MEDYQHIQIQDHGQHLKCINIPFIVQDLIIDATDQQRTGTRNLKILSLPMKEKSPPENGKYRYQGKAWKEKYVEPFLSALNIKSAPQ